MHPQDRKTELRNAMGGVCAYELLQSANGRRQFVAYSIQSTRRLGLSLFGPI